MYVDLVGMVVRGLGLIAYLYNVDRRRLHLVSFVGLPHKSCSYREQHPLRARQYSLQSGRHVLAAGTFLKSSYN